MKLTRSTEYAVLAVIQLAQSNASTPAVCAHLGVSGSMPHRFRQEVLRSLVAHGILTYSREVDGHFELAHKPEEISLLDLIEATDGLLVASLPVPPSVPSNVQNKLHDAIEKSTSAARQELRRLMLSDLLT